MEHDVKELRDIRIMYISTIGNPAVAFMELEKVVPLKGNNFYGVMYKDTGEYWACVEMKAGHNPRALGLKTGVIKGGRYAYEILRGKYGDLLKQIAPMFEDMVAECDYDPTRPSVEYYKRFNEFELYLPIQ